MWKCFSDYLRINRVMKIKKKKCNFYIYKSNLNRINFNNSWRRFFTRRTDRHSHSTGIASASMGTVQKNRINFFILALNTHISILFKFQSARQFHNLFLQDFNYFIIIQILSLVIIFIIIYISKITAIAVFITSIFLRFYIHIKQ